MQAERVTMTLKREEMATAMAAITIAARNNPLAA